jgi:riboflavin kinase/FMN adenylyltransferase
MHIQICELGVYIINSPNIPSISNPIVTQGTYDGVHTAHQVILNRLKQVAFEQGGETVVITFHPHPRLVLYPDDTNLKLLHTLDEKIKALEEYNINHLVVIPFTKEFSRLSSLSFIKDILVDKLHTHTLVIGYNHRFGKNREGTFEHLKDYGNNYGLNVYEIPKHEVDHEAVSSTRIRHALETGNVQLANKYLGYSYNISGDVVSGKQLGRTIGFPTANIQLHDPLKLVPSDGVYAVKININNQIYDGMLNCGMRPTVDGNSHSIEVHIFNFNNAIYGEPVRIFYVDKLRNEIKFDSVENLKSQLEIDKLQALHTLKIANISG